jgi:hypothetical protein
MKGAHNVRVVTVHQFTCFFWYSVDCYENLILWDNTEAWKIMCTVV